MLIAVLMCNFLKYLLFLNFWGKFHPKICCSPYLLKFSIEIRQNSVNIERTRWNEICPKFIRFEELYILGPYLPKISEWKNFEKINIKAVISIWQCTPVRNFNQFEEFQIMEPNMPKKYKWQKFWKNKHQNRHKHVTKYPFTKFQSFWRNPD